MNRVAAIQMASGPNVQANLLEADRLITQAVEQGASLVVLPENFALMGMHDDDQLRARELPGTGPIQEFLASTAARRDLWLVGGTLPLAAQDSQHVRETCLVYDTSGSCVGSYAKIHLFDVHIEDAGESYNESAVIEAGADPLVVDTPLGRIGVAVGYDLRFPELFRHMVSQGMEIAVVPSTFTRITGQAHWEPLLRARAIENLCFMVAAAQGGYHLNGRETWGHSMIIDPWGGQMASVQSGTGVTVAEVDRARLLRTRRNFPVIEHRRFVCALSTS
ncbi:MAG: carbon-nitrogen hydrolase family protein [Gammaproteobacteria bacterium]|nr:carbon-nitrogen hydrolase family protein [Gammaproteobacteria bacterium]